jgi:hypothetical protein
MYFADASYGFLSYHDRTWFFKIDLSRGNLRLLVSKAKNCGEFLKATFFTLYKSKLTDVENFKRNKNRVETKISDETSKALIESSGPNGQSSLSSNSNNKTTSTKSYHNRQNNNISEVVIEGNQSVDNISPPDSGVSSLNSSMSSTDALWSVKELSILRYTWLCFPQNRQVIGWGLAGPIFKISFTGLGIDYVPLSLIASPVVVKSYEVFDNSLQTVDAREHIEHEIAVYTHLLNFSSSSSFSLDRWSAHIPTLHYAGNFLIFRGLILEYVDKSRVIKFSEMSDEEKEACKAALADLHKREILHADVHYRNFVLDSTGKAFILDFGRSAIGARTSLLRKEMSLLIWKLENSDDSVDQIMR